jgi:hypothetical protein
MIGVAFSALMLMAAAPVPSTLVCDAGASPQPVTIPLDIAGFTRFHARVDVRIAPKSGPMLAIQHFGPKGYVVFSMSVMVPPMADGSVPSVWSSMIIAGKTVARGNENALAQDFDLDLEETRRAPRASSWRGATPTASRAKADPPPRWRRPVREASNWSAAAGVTS